MITRQVAIPAATTTKNASISLQICGARLFNFSGGYRSAGGTSPHRVPTALSYLPKRTLMFITVLWFVSLVNFMDGIDWMIVAEVVPVTPALAVFDLLGALPLDATVVALALCGAIIGFAPFNRPVARLFLGVIGSLPIGLLGWLLVLLAGHEHLVAALLLPLYYLTDATITVLRRLISGEPITQAHRSHFYQPALANGFSVFQVVIG